MKRYIFGLALISFLTYLNSFGNGFVWDDLNNIIHNNALRGPLGLREIFLNPNGLQVFYRPIPYLTIWLDWHLFKDNPFGYHFTNFAFHLACVILIFFVCRRLTQSPNVSFISALIFAVHPAHTEAVTYISGRSDPICAFFILFASILYIKFLETGGRIKYIYLTGSLFLFLFSLFSKEIALIFPFAILLFDMYFLKSPLRMRIKRSALFLFLAIAFLLFRYFLVKHPALNINIGRFHLFPQIILYYLKILAFPFNLHMQHSLQGNIFLAVIIIGICIAAIARLEKKRVLTFGAAWFLIWLLPFSGMLRLNSDIAEHWLYISSFGFFLIAGHYLLKNKLILTALVLFLCIITIQRNFIWRSDISIYKDTLRYKPDDYKLHYNLGNAYLRRGLLKEAYKEYNIALKINPGHAYTLNNLRLIFDKAGNSYAFADEEGAYFDHSLYAQALNKFVKDGRVNYADFKKEPYLLNAYLEKVAKLDSGAFYSFPRDEKIALYINAYNAFTLKLIIDRYPLKSIRNIFGAWDRFKVKIAGSELTLNQIEHEILRKKFKEPRIHFALVCASKGCPELADEPFNGKDLNDQLERESKRFINDKTKVRLDKDNRTLYISSVFQWFSEDFGDVAEFISKYFPEEERAFIREKNPRLKYLKYDWSLNE